jgi:hypothetical protein
VLTEPSLRDQAMGARSARRKVRSQPGNWPAGIRIAGRKPMKLYFLP